MAKADLYLLAESLIAAQPEEGGLTNEECFRVFGIKGKSFYNWRRNRGRETEAQRKRRERLEAHMELFGRIVRKLGFVPGRRTFRVHMFRDYGILVSAKWCAKVMREMRLVANRPKRDAYKGQATHSHWCTAPADLIGRGFQVGPRQVILTDITYLYYGPNRTTFYLCCFLDAYTREILGAAAQTTMTTELVREAYEAMMAAHGRELSESTTSVYIHSDQGSQYTSTTFGELLSDDGFVQSCSRRGNSLDNAPMESFFGRMKCRIIDLVALCPNASTAIRMVLGYVDEYNNQMYQHKLAGLTPAEYYAYATTGVYPCDSYFGVEATELMPIGSIVEAALERERAREERARERMERRQRSEAERLSRTPEQVVLGDQSRLIKEKSKWNESMILSRLQVAHIDEVLEENRMALEFVRSAPPEVLEELRDPQRWREHEELVYVTHMDELF